MIATLTVVPKESPNGKPGEPSAPDQGGDVEFDPEPPPWLEVEKDLYFPMPVPEILLGKKKLIVEEGTNGIAPFMA